MTDDKLLSARIDAGRAKALLEDEMLKAAFEGIKRAYTEKLFNTTEDQEDVRERLYWAVRIAGEVQRDLQSFLDNGKLADAELNRLISIGQRKKGWNEV